MFARFAKTAEKVLTVGEKADHLCVSYFRDWLELFQSGCGCRFAQALAANARIAYWVSLEPLATQDIADLEQFLDAAGQEGRVVVVLHPRMRTPLEIATMLRALAAHESRRWSCEIVDWHMYGRQDDSPVSLTWRIASGTLSSAMGFAPLGSMPITRRAPYVALAIWPAENENAFAPPARPGEPLGFINGRHDLELEKYKKYTDLSRGRAIELMRDPPEDRVWLRKVAFCLPSVSVADFPPPATATSAT